MNGYVTKCLSDYTTKLKNLSDRIGYYGTHIFSIFFLYAFNEIYLFLSIIIKNTYKKKVDNPLYNMHSRLRV